MVGRSEKKLVAKFAGLKPQKMAIFIIIADLTGKSPLGCPETDESETSTSDLPNKLSFASYFLLRDVCRIVENGISQNVQFLAHPTPKCNFSRSVGKDTA
ncbi:MAG: hypothetical protein GY820_46460 [Gammaproteobacteria bacterium]|nr:hypothetical protein [Gammaproteobacteria bacterium]